MAESKGLPDDFQVDTQTPLLQTGLIDSLGMEELVTFLEAAFGIEVQDDDLLPDNFETVEAIAALIERKLGGSSGDI
ncbi:MAG: acyl carrier protein [Gemmatimonadota bacterium]|nr:MAG: acyl carrier protein [Gemmatimonadota bacterium]